MYRGLLGDFFFIKHEKDGEEFKMLIDCGVLQRIGSAQKKPTTSLGRDRIIAAVEDFISHTGKSIDLVVATHEHYDHLSGFILANEQFADLEIGKVWMAWTEDRTDKLANSYRAKKNKALAALARLTDDPAFAATSEMETVSNLLQFYGEIDVVKRSEMDAVAPKDDQKLPGNASCAQVLDWLRRRARIENVSFLKPGEEVRWGVQNAFHAYVLGPPRDDEKLRQLDPSKGAAREVYLARPEDAETVRGLSGRVGKEELQSDDLPFALPYRRHYDPTHRKDRRLQQARRWNDQVVMLYELSDAARRIDDVWSGSAEDLALKIDGDVNNTSLALAFELPDGKVLLFPGDAQVGNWLSWGDQTYPAARTKADGGRTIDELLSRTILYKVGHHASHNATLRDRGLELMTHPELCAMIPVVAKTAREQTTSKTPNGWAMPYGDLYKRLHERTNGRIVQGDGSVAEETSKFEGSIFTPSYGEAYDSGDPLWVELSLHLSGTGAPVAGVVTAGDRKSSGRRRLGRRSGRARR